MEGNPETKARTERLRDMARRALDALGAVDLDHIPVERIAELMGISRATFFRHFQSKEQVVVVGLVGGEDEFSSRLRPGSVTLNAPLWPLLREICEPVVKSSETDGAGLRRRVLQLRGNPLVSTQLRRARGPQIEALALAFAEQGVDRESAATVAGAAILTVDRCVGLWASAEGSELRPMVDRAFAQLARGY